MRSGVVRYDDVGDSAAWTGLHLAALAHEYNTTKNSTVLVCTHTYTVCNYANIYRKILRSHWMQFFF